MPFCVDSLMYQFCLRSRAIVGKIIWQLSSGMVLLRSAKATGKSAAEDVFSRLKEQARKSNEAARRLRGEGERMSEVCICCCFLQAYHHSYFVAFLSRVCAYVSIPSKLSSRVRRATELASDILLRSSSFFVSLHLAGSCVVVVASLDLREKIV